MYVVNSLDAHAGSKSAEAESSLLIPPTRWEWDTSLSDSRDTRGTTCVQDAEASKECIKSRVSIRLGT